MKRKSLSIPILFTLSFLSYAFVSNTIINITGNWKANTCPVHNIQLNQAEVDCVVGGFSGRPSSDSRDYKNPPYTKGKYPNAKYDYCESNGCIRLHEKAIILFCPKCEAIRRTAAPDKAH